MSPISKSYLRASTGMTLSEHISEARKRLLISLAAVVVLGTFAFIDYNQILHWLQQPLCAITSKNQTCTFLVTGPLDGLTLRIKIAFFGGFLFGSPIIFWEAWRFVTPGLKAREK